MSSIENWDTIHDIILKVKIILGDDKRSTTGCLKYIWWVISGEKFGHVTCYIIFVKSKLNQFIDKIFQGID